MAAEEKTIITIHAQVEAPMELVWHCWVTPEDIMQWNTASDDWHTTRAENNLVEGGTFLSRMEAKDGSFGFDFGGVYNKVEKYQCIEYTIGDGRYVTIQFKKHGNGVHITEAFEAEQINSAELQRSGWQAILNNFKKYTEEKASQQ